jgi:hypothetical protein
MAEGFKFRIFYPVRTANDFVPLPDVTELSTTEISVCTSLVPKAQTFLKVSFRHESLR